MKCRLLAFEGQLSGISGKFNDGGLGVERDYAQEEFENEHRLAQSELRLKRIKVPEGMVRRYYRTYYDDGYTIYDIIWIDRQTGKEVIRYDGADPANTNSYYGAISDEEMFRRCGLDPYEVIPAADAVGK
jgi:hypothetical protein